MAYRFKHGDRPLDDYTIQRAVGAGGFGEVYYAVSDGGREVALKYLRENPQVELRGVSHCINLKSPYLVSIFDVKKNADGDYFIIMEYCSGPSLRDLLIAEPDGFGPQKAAFFAREIAKGLSYLHDRGIVHRDLKPGNIFYDDGYVKIGDYGLSKFISVSRHSVQTSSVGTVHYMAPEIGSGDYSRGVDIYALGVILYEMLLGKVPFEGSTLAEVLMKHLTTQPEVDQLPQPFGQIIRKALQKDPRERYQTVNEMVDELLGMEEVRNSLAGFSPRSLEGAVRRGGAETVSPVPSPNPLGAYPHGAGKQAGPPRGLGEINPEALVSERVSRRLDRISRKLDKKMAKLVGRLGQRPVQPPPPRAVPGSEGDAGRTLRAGERRRRMALSGLLAIGLAVGLGLLVGNSHSEEAGAAAGMGVCAMSGGILLARRATKWFGVLYGPKWSLALIRLCCCVPLTAIACAPLFDSSDSEGGVAVWLALLLLATFANWEKNIERASGGEMCFWSALWMAFCGLITTAIVAALLDVDPDDVMFIGAGVAGAVSLITQASSWWLAGRSPELPPPPGESGLLAVGPGRHASVAVALPTAPDACCPSAPCVEERPDISGMKGASETRSTSAAGAPGRQERWLLTRAFWSIVAFALMGGAIVTFLFPLIADDAEHHDITASIVGCTGFAAFMLFALLKTTLRRRGGFWRDTLRPFLISLSLFGIGGTITGIACEWNHYDDSCEIQVRKFEESLARFRDQAAKASARGHRLRDLPQPPEPPPCAEDLDCFDSQSCLGAEGRVALVSGLVMSSLMLLVLTFFTGGRPRTPRPFVLPGSGMGNAPDGQRDILGGRAAGQMSATDSNSAGLRYADLRPAGDVRPPTAPPDRHVSARFRAHRGVTVLVLGILGINFFPLGIAAWVMGSNDLHEMDAGRMDDSGRGMTSAGRICGIIGTVLAFFGLLIGMAAIVATMH